MKRLFHRAPTALVLSVLIAAASSAFATDKEKDGPKWIEVHSTHFSVVTDAGDKRGREVALRMEQMRTVFGRLLLKDKLHMSVPITVIALKSDAQYGAISPLKQSQAAGFWIPGWDRIYVVLNLFQPDPWQAVAHPLAHYLLNYNYPPTQGWFDEGLAEYFGSIHIGRQVELGGDPELQPEWHEDAFDQMTRDPKTPQSLTQLLGSPVWIALPDLFAMKHDGSGAREGTHNTLYYAQSWMIAHYLINKKKMPEVGAYFDLVLNQKVPVDKAIVRAFDMSPEQMEAAVRAYFNSLGGLGVALEQAKKPVGDPVDAQQPDHFPLPFDADDFGMAVSAVKEEDAKATLDDAEARIPERRDHALLELRQLTKDPKDNEGARRALAYENLRQKKFDAASDELEKAADLNSRDPWIAYYRAVLKYQRAQATRKEIQGLGNTMQDLRAVIDWYPDLADAYNMLGMARVEGGGINSALEAQKLAITLSPRKVEYQFNLGQIYVAGKKWDAAREIFARLQTGPDRAAAGAAKQQLEDLDTLQKYGIRPQRTGKAETPPGAASTPSAGKESQATIAQDAGSIAKNDAETKEGDDDEPAQPAPSRPAAAAPVQFVKGKIVSSDCSMPPEATITFLSGMTMYKMHASDYKSLPLIGEERFSCDWRNRLASINYRATGKSQGELVSLELR